MGYETVLKGGRVIDPATGRDGQFDVAIKGGKIAAIEPTIAPDGAEVVDLSGKIVIAGMIDTHGHIYQHVTGKFGLNPDMVGVRSGVTTIIDQGGPSCMTLGGFKHLIDPAAKTKLYCFISAYLVGGLEGHMYPDLYGPNGVNPEHTIRVAKENLDIVRGVKAHAEIGGQSRWGMEVIKVGKQISRELGLPLYIHLGQLWPSLEEGPVPDPDELIRELVPIMEEGDMLAHPFTRHPGGFVSEEGEVHPIVFEAIDRGVRVDVGHGSHFSFEVAKKVLDTGIKPFTLGADMHGFNVTVPPEGLDKGLRESNPFFGAAPFNLTVAMTELITLGMTLPEVVATVTQNPATVLGKSDELGSLQVSRGADISVLEIIDGKFKLFDNSGVEVVTDKLVRPVMCFKDGERFDSDSPLIPPPVYA
ncbi:amidohydrolase/deacetylase family metallohydrolase [Vannielia litorea]|uniref:amidohydrolase/deacetylase family metallohydrolase n=1 Tax=Vannielia litorea TaxID=1217970 RepID=UPI001C976EB2|nr:amidohydrolase/deacetylase family metallohydrolase [Vannielia litorea]MBY6046314.1 amidohydrolase/deacetylase family metallohydrolase [Vannielia litorea]MBY6073727.1 amidohydrolase/deacetylase family metallohydrolase [Vannielia litorea]MBY6153773.1 amidohydrolase/deacetylase family metallohydrolase [Vannielia litorea]